MQIERTKNAKRNIVFGVIQKIYTLLVPFAIRTAMIYFLGVEYLGLGSLFTSILTVLNLTELGVGGALVFSMYKPIAEDDTERISALMKLYRTYYRIIGTVILIVGVAITPIVPKLVTGHIPEGINLIVLYYLNLGWTVLSYFLFAYKNSIFQAHQRLDIPSKIQLLTSTIQFALQFVAIFLGNYYLYVVVALFSTALCNIITAIAADKLYPDCKPEGSLEKKEVKEINKRIRDLFTSKVGSVVVDSADTIVISAFLGLKVLGIYNNYYFILVSIFGFIGIIFNSCTAGIGNSLIVETEEKNYLDLKKFLMIIAWVTGFCTAMLACLYQPFMKLWVGPSLMLDMKMVVCFCCYFFIHEINRLINNYKDAAGMWHEDKWRPLVVAIINLTLNLATVRYLGLFGILLSTVVSMLLVGWPWLIYNLFTVVFKRNAREFVLKIIKYTLLTAIGAITSYYLCSFVKINGIPEIAIKGLIVCIAINLLFFIVLRKSKEYPEVKQLAKNIIRKQ